jgi:hypothetical protein
MPTDLTSDNMNLAAGALTGKGPIQMVNLLRYSEDAHYPDGSKYPSCSGREAYYQRYISEFGKVASKVAPNSFSITFIGNVQATLVAPAAESWDDIAIIEYSSFEAFRDIVESAQYLSDADPHRRAALKDWRFIATTKASLPS